MGDPMEALERCLARCEHAPVPTTLRVPARAQPMPCAFGLAVGLALALAAAAYSPALDQAGATKAAQALAMRHLPGPGGLPPGEYGAILKRRPEGWA